MVYELRVCLNSGSCRELMQKGLIKGIYLSSLRCWSFSVAAAGRLVRGCMFEKLHSKRVKAR